MDSPERVFARLLIDSVTDEWIPEDWEGEDEDNLVDQAEQMVRETPSLMDSLFYAKFAFEQRMGW